MKILGFGAILWDKINDNLNIGGAVFNLIAHCKKMGWDAYLATSIGKDSLGEKAFKELKEKGIGPDLVKRIRHPTCIVEVSLDKNGEPSYSLDNPTSWDFIEISPKDIKFIEKTGFDCFCFGTIEQRGKINLVSIKNILENCTFKHRFFDMNLRLDYFNKDQIEYYMDKCNILKINDNEFEMLKQAFGFKNDKTEKILAQLINKFNIEIICLTRSSSGAYAYSEGNLVKCQGYEIKVINTVGSGDAFSAAFLTKIHQGRSLNEALYFACRMGAFVATAEGALPDYSINNIDKMLDARVPSHINYK